MKTPITIISGERTHVTACCEALIQSPLGKPYFGDPEYTRKFVVEGIDKKEIFVAITDSGVVVGFVWFALRGAFYRFPYLRTCAVGSQFRGMGVGSALLSFYEEKGFAEASQVFLLVSDFNTAAQKFYSKAGYTQIGAIPCFGGGKITELIFMKSKPG